MDPKNPCHNQHFIRANLFEDANDDIDDAADEAQRDATMCVLYIVAHKIFTSRLLKLIKD